MFKFFFSPSPAIYKYRLLLFFTNFEKTSINNSFDQGNGTIYGGGTTWVDWVELLELPDARLNSWVEAMKSLLTVDESPQGYRSFSNSLRRDADDFINGIWSQVREVNPDLNWRTESAKRGQLENAFNILKEGFERKTILLIFK